MCIATLHKDRAPSATWRCYIPASFGIDLSDLEFAFLSLCLLVLSILLLYEIKVQCMNLDVFHHLRRLS